MKIANAVLLLSLACAGTALCQQYKLEKAIQIGGSGGWDYLAADSDNRRLYVSHGSEVDVVDLDSQKVIGQVTGMQRIHGIAIDAASGKGFISDGGSNNVVIFDLKTLAVQTKVNAGQNPDAILFDPASKKVFAFNGRSQDVSVIDPQAGTVVKTLPAGGKPEFAATDGEGNVYFNVEDKSEIAHIDSNTLQVKEHWSIAPCESPSGLAIDASSKRLFAVCENEKMAVVDATTGKVVATPEIGKGPDAAAFDVGRKFALSSNGASGTITVVKENGPDQYSVVETIKTERGARTMALDQKTHRIYLSDASFGPAPAASADNPHPRPAIVPGSFRLLVVSPQ